MAPSPGDDPVAIHPPNPSTAAQTATRRAVASLRRYGLIALMRVSEADPTPRTLRVADPAACAVAGRAYMRLRFMRRTSLGEEIAKRYRQELESGGRIRWLVGLDDAREACLAACPRR